MIEKKRFGELFVYFTVWLISFPQTADCKANLDELGFRIMGGEDAGFDDASFLVSLRSSDGSHFCGGAIISHKTIITAARCLSGYTPTNMYIVAGSKSLITGGVRCDVSDIIIHDSYYKNNSIPVNDIALIIVKQKIEFISDTIDAVPINPDYFNDQRNPLTVSGWGQKDEASTNSNTLQFKEGYYITNENCLKEQSDYIDRIVLNTDMMCLQSSMTCIGDFGGPLVDFGGRLVGIASYTFGTVDIPCGSGFPDVYTRISSFADWIKTNMIS